MIQVASAVRPGEAARDSIARRGTNAAPSTSNIIMPSYRGRWFLMWVAGACACTARARDEGLTRTAEVPPVVPNAEVPSTEVLALRTRLVPDDALIDWDANPIMKTLGRMSRTMTQTEYTRAGARVDERKGIYAFDCSGMAEWVLRKATPAAGRHCADGLGHRPLASDFYHRIAATWSFAGFLSRCWRCLTVVRDSICISAYRNDLKVVGVLMTLLAGSIPLDGGMSIRRRHLRGAPRLSGLSPYPVPNGSHHL